jgi:hypothetical protein
LRKVTDATPSENFEGMVISAVLGMLNAHNGIGVFWELRYATRPSFSRRKKGVLMPFIIYAKQRLGVG